VSENDKDVNPYGKGSRGKFTIANPFITDEMKLIIVDLDNLTDEQKAMPRQAHDWSFAKQPHLAHFFVFHWCEYTKNAVPNDESTAFQTIGERAFFVDYESAQNYFKYLHENHFVEYVCFQYEKGDKTGLLHLQGFMRYKKIMFPNKVRVIFPTMSLKQCGMQSNQECRAYCCKEETKVDGFDFFEWGNFTKIGQRNDLVRLIQAIKDDMPYEQLLENFPYQMMNMGDKVEKTRQNLIREKFKNVEREIHVTYIYGVEGTGKTTFPYRVLGLQYQDVFKVSNYKHSGKYDNYKCQDVILFDEFHGQIDITEMNDMLNGQPYDFPCRYNDRSACFTKAIFTSNYPMEEAYKNEIDKGKMRSFKGFQRRVTEIIYMPERNHYIWQLGRPSDEIIDNLKSQGAKIKLPPQEITQGEIDIAEVF